MTDLSIVSDHALIRFLERECDIDLSDARAYLERRVAEAVAAGASALYRDGFTYVLRDGRLITIHPGRPQCIVRQGARASRKIAREEGRP